MSSEIGKETKAIGTVLGGRSIFSRSMTVHAISFSNIFKQSNIFETISNT